MRIIYAGKVWNADSTANFDSSLQRLVRVLSDENASASSFVFGSSAYAVGLGTKLAYSAAGALAGAGAGAVGASITFAYFPPWVALSLVGMTASSVAFGGSIAGWSEASRIQIKDCRRDKIHITVNDGQNKAESVLTTAGITTTINGK